MGAVFDSSPNEPVAGAVQVAKIHFDAQCRFCRDGRRATIGGFGPSISSVCLLKIPSEPKPERRHSISFGCDQTEPPKVEIARDRHPKCIERFNRENAWKEPQRFRCRGINGRCDELRRQAVIVVVQPADSRDGADSAAP